MNTSKIPLIVLTDISTNDAKSGEPDDTQSLYRLLLYSDIFDIKGLIATYTPHRNKACPEYIHTVIDNYKKIYGNLLKTNRPFGSPDSLHGCVARGSDTAGDASCGAGKNTSGADLIFKAVCESKEPIWITVWGGCTDLYQALLQAESGLDRSAFTAFCKKLRVYAISDQYDNCGALIRQTYRELFYLTSYDNFRGMYRLGDTSLCSSEWVSQNIEKASVYGEAYPNYDGGDKYSGLFGNVQGIKEGDTPSFLHLIPNGLCDPMKPAHGSWGGFFKEVSANRYFDAPIHHGAQYNSWAGVYKYREDFQNDFLIRLKWTAGERTDLQYPEISIDTEDEITADFYAKINIKAQTSPDCAIEWTQCVEAGSYNGVLILNQTDGGCEICSVPDSTSVSGMTAHIIVKATTRTSPYAVRYKRIIIRFH